MLHLSLFTMQMALLNSDASQLISSRIGNCECETKRRIVITNTDSTTDDIHTKITLNFGSTRIFYCPFRNCNNSNRSKINWIIPDKVPLVTNGETNFGAHFSGNLSVLTLKSIQKSYSGTYTCFVTSVGGICHVINFLVDVSEGTRLSMKHRLLIGFISFLFTVLLLFLGRKIHLVFCSRRYKAHVMPVETETETSNTELEKF